MFSGARKPTTMKKKLHTGKPKIPSKALFIARQLLHDMILRLEFSPKKAALNIHKSSRLRLHRLENPTHTICLQL
jgi:hypothetical protein